MAELLFDLEPSMQGGTSIGFDLDSSFVQDERTSFWEDAKETVTGVVKFGTEIVPFGRYVWKEERERWDKMSQGERAMAVGWEGLSALMWWKGPAIVRGAWKLGSKGLGRVTGGRVGKKVIQPIEDLIDIQSKSYAELASKKLKKSGFSQNEIPAVIDAARGNNNALLGAFRERALEGKGMSKGWQKNVDMMTDPWLQFSPKKQIMDALVPETLKRKVYEGEITKQIAKIFKKDYNPRYIDEVFSRHAKKYTEGEHIIRMRDATDDLVWNVMRDMQDSPKLLLKLTTPGPFSSMRPMQAVWGDLNKLYGTYDDVYKVGVEGIETKAKFGVEWTSLLNRMKAERGFGAIVTKTDRAGHAYDAFKPAKFYNKELKTKTNEFMQSVRDMMQTVGNEQLDDAGRIMTLQERTAAVERVILEARENAPKMVDLAETMWDFNNKLFEFGMLPEIERAFLKAGMTAYGLEKVLGPMFKQIQSGGRMKSIFNVMRKETDVIGRSTIDIKNPFRRSEEIKELLGEFQKIFQHTIINPEFAKNPALAVNHLFNKTGPELMGSLNKLMGDLTMKKGGQKYGFTSYIEGYFARIGKGGEIMPDKAIDGLPMEMKAFFTKQAVRDVAKQPLLGLDETMAGRISAQGNEMYLYPAIGKISQTAQHYPEAIRKHVSHYVARLAGQPSPADHAAAKFLNNMPGLGSWDGRRVRELSGVINDFTYMGFLGIKPFSAMRNMFQPLINVPAELGGVGDFNTLLRGYYKVLTSPARRTRLRDMGIITEYAPEIMYSTGMRNKVREGMMWMFRWSDESNRLVTGSAALDKWERAVAKMPGISSGRDVAKFMAKSGASKRRSWIAKEIEQALTRKINGKPIPDLVTAERLFVRDATAVTQYLYGALDAPLITQIGGIFGRTGAIFQSWWMNYGDMMMRWYTGGQKPGEKVQRAAIWATSSAIAWIAMNEMWGSATATKTVGLGPFPKSMVIPPTWEPIFKGLQVITTAGETAFTQDPDKLSRESKALLGSLLNFAPGGLQLKQMFRGYQKDEFVKSIFKIK